MTKQKTPRLGGPGGRPVATTKSAPGIKERKVQLPIVGAEAEITLPIPGGKGSLTTILPAMRKLSAAMMGIAETEKAKHGSKVSCRLGCAHCCHHLIPISLAEAKAISVALERLPPPRQKAIRKRFESTLVALEEGKLLGPKGDEPRTALQSEADSDASEMWSDVNQRYFSMHLPCAFLDEQNKCSIYEERPFVCREYMVTSDPELCRTLDPRVEPVPRSAYITQAMSEVVAEFDDILPGAIPLPLMLEWLAARGSELAVDHDPAAALDSALDALDWNQEEVCT